jgi:hypothetical protein
MDLSELETRPAAEDGARLRRAQLARRTFGISPASLMLGYTDGRAHVLIAPDKHELLARKAVRRLREATCRLPPRREPVSSRADWTRPRVGLREGGAL